MSNEGRTYHSDFDVQPFCNKLEAKPLPRGTQDASDSVVVGWVLVLRDVRTTSQQTAHDELNF